MSANAYTRNLTAEGCVLWMFVVFAGHRAPKTSCFHRPAAPGHQAQSLALSVPPWPSGRQSVWFQGNDLLWSL
jgi:hypothetical protein